MICRELNIKWTKKVEVWREGHCIQRPSVWEGINQDGKKVRVYITKIEEVEDEMERATENQ